MKNLIALLSLLAAVSADVTTPYVGGNQFDNYYTNPNLINSFLSQVNATVSPACNSIAGVGQPILALKQVLQSVDAQLDSANRDSAVKILFFRERKNNTTFQSDYKLVLELRSFAATNYLAVEGLYKQVGFPTFEVLTYYLDSSIENVRSAIGEPTVDPNAFVGCGDVKSIYSQANSALPRPAATTNGAQGYGLVNAAPAAAGAAAAPSNVDPAVVAQVIALLSARQ